MGHPLVGNLSSLTDDELTKKISELNNRLSTVYRLGYSEALYQLQMILEDYMNEHHRRQQKMMEEMLEKTNGKYGDIIDIN